MLINKSFENAKNIIIKNGGFIQTGQAIKAGIHPRTLYQMRDEGVLEILSRGIYKLTNSETMSNIDIFIVSQRSPKSVICLISALHFHEITTQISRSVSIALPSGFKKPHIDFPPIDVHNFSDKSYNAGIKEYLINNYYVKVYDPEKTIADCFKFRNKIGMDIVLESLNMYKANMKVDLNKLYEYSIINRVEKIMIPYLEATF